MEEINGRNVGSKLTRRETIATLVRSECISFKAFLHRMKVPGFDNPNCDCAGGFQTAKHMILYCPPLRREQLFEEAGSQDYRELTSTVRELRAVAKWTIRSGLLAQFKLSSPLIMPVSLDSPFSPFCGFVLFLFFLHYH